MQDSGSLAVFKVTARDQGHYKGPWGAFVTYCNISVFIPPAYEVCYGCIMFSSFLCVCVCVTLVFLLLELLPFVC